MLLMVCGNEALCGRVKARLVVMSVCGGTVNTDKDEGLTGRGSGGKERIYVAGNIRPRVISDDGSVFRENDYLRPASGESRGLVAIRLPRMSDAASPTRMVGVSCAPFRRQVPYEKTER